MYSHSSPVQLELSELLDIEEVSCHSAGVVVLIVPVVSGSVCSFKTFLRSIDTQPIEVLDSGSTTRAKLDRGTKL
jgi:hypothetical protein